MTTSDLFERFCAHLRVVDPRNKCGQADGIITVYLEGSDERAEFLVTERALQDRVRMLDADARVLWPDAGEDVAAFRLLSIHLMEQVAIGHAARYAFTQAGFTEA